MYTTNPGSAIFATSRKAVIMLRRGGEKHDFSFLSPLSRERMFIGAVKRADGIRRDKTRRVARSYQFLPFARGGCKY